MLAATTDAMTAPNTRNSPIRVHSSVLNTEPYSTSLNHSRSV
jgi:hypothetical protein